MISRISALFALALLALPVTVLPRPAQAHAGGENLHIPADPHHGPVLDRADHVQLVVNLDPVRPAGLADPFETTEKTGLNILKQT